MANKTDRPLVSVIIPAFNCSNYIDDAVKSIFKQTYTELQIIVIDDCSTDDTWKKLEHLAKQDDRLEIHRNESNLKIVDTLNKAIALSKGKYIARMDGDDIRLPDSIKKQVGYLEAHKNVVIVGGSIMISTVKMKPINERNYPHSDKEIRKTIFRFSPFAHPTIMMRASIAKAEKYNPVFNWAEDYDLYFRLGKHGEFANLPDTLLRLRTHNQSVSRKKTKTQEKLTLYIRLKAVFEYGYCMRLTDRFYFLGQLSTMYIMPNNVRFWIFNNIRKIMK